MGKIEEAYERHKAASMELTEAIQERYPEGAVCAATTAHGHVIEAQVVCHGHSWSNPESVRVRNLQTGGMHWIPFSRLGPPSDD